MTCVKRIFAIFLALLLIVTSAGIPAFAEIMPSDMDGETITLDTINLNGGVKHIRQNDTVYYPITVSTYSRIANLREGTDVVLHDYTQLVTRKTGLADGRTVITSHVVYDADSLAF